MKADQRILSSLSTTIIEASAWDWNVLIENGDTLWVVWKQNKGLYNPIPFSHGRMGVHSDEMYQNWCYIILWGRPVVHPATNSISKHLRHSAWRLNVSVWPLACSSCHVSSGQHKNSQAPRAYWYSFKVSAGGPLCGNLRATDLWWRSVIFWPSFFTYQLDIRRWHDVGDGFTPISNAGLS